MDDEIEYQELSADWRHRDSLTWRIFAVVIAVVGVLVSIGFQLIGEVASVIVWTIFIFATGFASCLTFALGQNLLIQKKTADILKSIYGNKTRFDFRPIGSIFLLVLCISFTVFLFFLLYVSWVETLKYWELL